MTGESDMAELVRVAALTGYFTTMLSFRQDPLPVLREVGLSKAMLANPEQMLPARAAMRLLERSAEITGCSTLGLRMAEGRTIADLGATSLLIAHQPTLRAVIQAVAENRNRINSTLILHMDELEDVAILRDDFSLKVPEPSRQACDLVVGVLVRLCQTVLGSAWSPVLACFTHEAPPTSEMPIYQRLFGCRPEFNAEFNGLVIERRDLDLPNPMANSALVGHARNLIDTAMSPAASSITQDVEKLIALLLPAGRANIRSCAASLGITVRTLQRMLDAEQAQFSDALNRARMQLAQQHLANPRTRITDIADMLGYSSIGAFTRWHKGAFGMPPSESKARQSSK
jgi:AraC-like DNA-binding protein